jgi:hypothetical protein
MSMQSNAPQFPEWFVPDCPPPDAADAKGTVYRFVAEMPLKSSDFVSYHETQERPNAPACQRCGLSVFRKVEDVRELLLFLWKTYPRKSYGPHVVKRELSAADGKIKATGKPGHQTWWAYEGVERHASFELVETVQRS